MTTHGSVTLWLGRLKAGESGAAGPLWNAYFQRLVELARQQLRGLRGGAADEEDVALSAFDSFCRGARQGRFPRLEDRDDLWQLLLMITARKAVNLLKHERRKKRGEGQVVPLSALAGRRAEGEEADALAEVMGREPTPELAAQVAEECRRLLNELENEELRVIAVAKMEGHTNAEIAQRLGRGESTVERKLTLIRKAWEREVSP
jgi:DNA-directed RNA polymerase specialized sigma24 family protein